MIMLYRNIKKEREGGDYFVSSDISTQPEGGEGGDLILRFRTSWVGGGGSKGKGLMPEFVWYILVAARTASC